MNKFYVCGVTTKNKGLSLNKLEVKDEDFLKTSYDFIGTTCLDVREIDLHDVDRSIPEGTYIDVWFDDEFLYKEINDEDGDTLITKLPDGTEIIGNIILATSNDEGETCGFPDHYAFSYVDKWVRKQCFAGLPPQVARDYLKQKLRSLEDIGFVTFA